MPIKIRFLILIWLVGFNLSWPALLADHNAIYFESEPLGKAWNENYACKKFRGDLGTSMSFAILPPTWFLVPFLTGFYEHGFMFSKPSYCVKYEGI